MCSAVVVLREDFVLLTNWLRAKAHQEVSPKNLHNPYYRDFGCATFVLQTLHIGQHPLVALHATLQQHVDVPDGILRHGFPAASVLIVADRP